MNSFTNILNLSTCTDPPAGTVQYSLYCPSCRYGHPVPRAELVWAGHEPQDFCHLFPVWRQEEEAVKANEQVSP